MASAEVVGTSVTKNSPSHDSKHPDDLLQSRYYFLLREIVYVVEVRVSPPLPTTLGCGVRPQ